MANSQRICVAEGCGKPHSAKGLCVKHYARFRKHGSHADDALSARYMRRMRWIKEHASYDGDECLIWPFAVNETGRGQVRIKGRTASAPRAMCIEAHGEPPTADHHAAHSCGNGHRGCVNPKHLRWATPAENEGDKRAHGTLRRGDKINTSRLSEDDVRSIRESTESGVALAKRYGVTAAAISSIRTGKNWGWLK